MKITFLVISFIIISQSTISVQTFDRNRKDCSCDQLTQCVDNSARPTNCYANCQSKLRTGQNASSCFQQQQYSMIENSKSCLLRITGCSSRKRRHNISFLMKEENDGFKSRSKREQGTRIKINSEAVRREFGEFRGCFAQCHRRSNDFKGGKLRLARHASHSESKDRSSSSDSKSREREQRRRGFSFNHNKPDVFGKCMRMSSCFPDERFKSGGGCGIRSEQKGPQSVTFCLCLQKAYGSGIVSCDDSSGPDKGNSNVDNNGNNGGIGGRQTQPPFNGGNGNNNGGGGGAAIPTRPPPIIGDVKSP